MFDREHERLATQPASGRIYIEPLETMHKRIDKKFNYLDGYRFVANPGRERLIAVQSAKMLLTKMLENIDERERNGVD